MLATTGAANARTVAEHALYLMLALAKRGPALERAVKGGAWPRGFGAIELAGRSTLVVGYGRIARRPSSVAIRNVRWISQTVPRSRCVSQVSPVTSGHP